MIFFLLEFLILLAFVLFLACVVRTWQIQHSAKAKIFLNGSVELPMPDGLYHGTVSGRHLSWLGKKFNSAAGTGINVFDGGNGTQKERYPFKTSIGKGLIDEHLNVLKIDYNIPENPFWMRIILDEIVEVRPNEYLGKLEVRIFPGFPFALTYFELKK